MPYEVRGSIALHASEIRPFVQEMQRLELASFGAALHQFRTELKGCKLLDKDRFEWAAQDSLIPDAECRARSPRPSSAHIIIIVGSCTMPSPTTATLRSGIVSVIASLGI